MPSLASIHPQTVHFVVALIVVGVAFRWLSLAFKAGWLSMAATALVAIGTAASLVAVRSGNDAHGPVEAVPGARAAVVLHEEWGERARNAFVVLLAAEAGVLVLTARAAGAARSAALLAGVLGLLCVGVLYRAADLGGRLVYGYAGGVAVDTGDPEDVHRLLIAAMHRQAAQDRQEGRPLAAAGLVDSIADRFPAHLELQLSRIESTISDRKDPAAALARLDAIRVPTDDVRLRIRAGTLRASALATMGDLSAARQVLETLRSEFPTNAALQRRLAELAQRP